MTTLEQADIRQLHSADICVICGYSPSGTARSTVMMLVIPIRGDLKRKCKDRLAFALRLGAKDSGNVRAYQRPPFPARNLNALPITARLPMMFAAMPMISGHWRMRIP